MRLGKPTAYSSALNGSTIEFVAPQFSLACRPEAVKHAVETGAMHPFKARECIAELVRYV